MALKWHGWATKRGLAISKFLHLGFGFEEGRLPETKRTTTPEAGDYMFPTVTARPARREYDTRRPREREKATTHYYVRKFDPSSARAVSSPGVARLLSFAPSASPRNAQPSVVSSNRTTPSQASSFAQ